MGKEPATHLTISDSKVVDGQLERGRHLRCVLKPPREKGIVVSYKCQGKDVSVSFGYVGPGNHGQILLIIDEHGIVECDDNTNIDPYW